MSEIVEIKAVPRDVIGKANRRLSHEGLIPASLYGADVKATSLALSRHDFELLTHHEGLTTMVLHLNVEGSKSPVNAIIKEIQFSPVKGAVRHVDFMAVKMNQALHTTVPIHYVGDSAGVKAGGVLTQSMREFHIEALPKDLIENLEVDIASLEVGDNLHVSDIIAPSGVTILDDAETIVCSVTPPTVAPSEEELAAQTEPEVIGEAKEEAE